MKKIVFILVLLLFTAPAWATIVIIDANQVGDTNQVEITYEVVLPDVNLPRAFGLDITVTEGNIVDCIPYMTGECTDSDKGFGIFPSTIEIDAAPPIPQITYAGNPVSTIQPALGGLDTNGITIELGSLYQDANYPPSSGVLCTIVITKSCIVRIVGNAARCGESSPAIGVVMEDLDEIPIVTFGTADVNIDDGPGPCIPSDHPAYDDWVLMGEPNSWCNKRQCHGDADGLLQGDPKTGYYYVGAGDLAVLLGAWQILEPAVAPIPSGPGIEGMMVGSVEALAADWDHIQQGDPKTGYYRVGAGDLAILLANWQVLEPAIAPIPSGPGLPEDCLDVVP